ncbi:hypothetical protein, unknown function [Leishmania infantum JPCM5]|uniref:Uncharacterized protein n=2 Tax=Leishmania infantum TaxID=5671 RepID=A4HUD1_LEIIN|nr:hypothetical protein, unknown function [Leishmania infantum JPCM5]CAC9456727.1 hypothetical_protein_-_conserved [Leishmania infantum]CAM66039.1 hypothetical protein, unknown function [Leishmania infantum JPCM5]SUZ39642.1 hypothetical_protein_-_conserved [Leishmania infantum]|eukprot:XP_001463672.1 hypothetical protein, unknown function [Leishmania infantum JPCM5]
MPTIRNLTAVAAVVAATVLLVATSATAQADQMCSDPANPLASIDYSDAAVQACVVARCTTTLNVTPTITADGFCDGVATSESSAPCNKLEMGYNAYYACLVHALQGTNTTGLAEFGAAAKEFFSTPGFPYRLSLLGCYACNHYRLTVFPSLDSKCSNWTCATVSSQSPSAPAYGQPDEGYNHRLCSTGCITGIIMIPFTVVTCAIFFACGCCWPSPSLKTTYEAMLQEERRKYRRHPAADDDDSHDLDNGCYSLAHEPAPVSDQKSHPEVAGQHSVGN